MHSASGLLLAITVVQLLRLAPAVVLAVFTTQLALVPVHAVPQMMMQSGCRLW